MNKNADIGEIHDLLVVGGGTDGCGIAYATARQGLSVPPVEMNALAAASSSASTKLLYGGLRYLEGFEFRLFPDALLRAAPRFSRPKRFVPPHHKDMRFESGAYASRLPGAFVSWMRGRRPAWMIRFGLFLQDALIGREILPGKITLETWMFERRADQVVPSAVKRAGGSK